MRGCHGRGPLALASLPSSTTPPARDQPQLCSTSTYLDFLAHLSRHPRRQRSGARLRLPPLVPTTTSTADPISPTTLLSFASALGTSLLLIKDDFRHRSCYLLGPYLSRDLRHHSSVEASEVAALLRRLEQICHIRCLPTDACTFYKTVEHTLRPDYLTASGPVLYSPVPVYKLLRARISQGWGSLRLALRSIMPQPSPPATPPFDAVTSQPSQPSPPPQAPSLIASNTAAGSKRKRVTEKKFYAVKEGKSPGIYNAWDECLAQVRGHKGALCKF